MEPAVDALASSGSKLIEIHVAELKDLFNDIHPSPFREKDLDPEAEDFIVGWARDLPGEARLALVVWGEAPRAEDLARSADPPLYVGDLEPVDLPVEAVGAAHLRSLGRRRCVGRRVHRGARVASDQGLAQSEGRRISDAYRRSLLKFAALSGVVTPWPFTRWPNSPRPS
jgi:hypothetical protein